LVNNDTSFDDYYKVIKDNISKLFQEGYEDAVPLDAIKKENLGSKRFVARPYGTHLNQLYGRL